jgi:cytochrome c biogenesis protein
VEYENNRVHQFYSNLSVLDNYGTELKAQTISVNNPLRYKEVDIYQSDWNLLGIRVEILQDESLNKKVYEFPLFPLRQSSKAWVTWINDSRVNQMLVFDQLQQSFFSYDAQGNFLEVNNIGEEIAPNVRVLDILPSTGLLIKYDPSIQIIYSGFALLMLTASLSYLPYTQIWIFNEKSNSWLGSSTNRGKIQLEIEFENLVRYTENLLTKSTFFEKTKIKV